MAADGSGRTAAEDIEAIRAQLDALQRDLNGLVDAVGESATSRARAARTRAGAEAERIGAEAARLPDEAEAAFRRNPVAAILVFLGLGFLLGVAARR